MVKKWLKSFFAFALNSVDYACTLCYTEYNEGKGGQPKMKIYMNNKKISRKAAEALIGKERMDARIADAKAAYAEDPNEQSSWMDGMRIEF